MLVKVIGASVDILKTTNIIYERYVSIEKDKETIYPKLNKALYGRLKSVMLWKNLFSSTLQELGFTINGFDQCVANKVIDRTQCTVAWYVDVMKISHKQELVVMEELQQIEDTIKGDLTIKTGMHQTILADLQS